MATQPSWWARAVMKIADVQYRILDRLRHPEAFTAARAPAGASDLSAMRGEYVCLLVSYKRSGEPVPSPVLCAMDEGKVYVRCEQRSAKVRRIRRDPRVLAGPCSYRGKPRGPLALGTARELSGAGAARAHDLLFANYRWYDRLYETVTDRLPVDIAYFEITAAS